MARGANAPGSAHRLTVKRQAVWNVGLGSDAAVEHHRRERLRCNQKRTLRSVGAYVRDVTECTSLIPGGAYLIGIGMRS